MVLLADRFHDALPRCRECERVLVGAETVMCDECADALCAACGEQSVEFYVPGLPAQLCNDCHDRWAEWHDHLLPEQPFEADLQESRERFCQTRKAAHAQAQQQFKNKPSAAE